MIRVVIKDVIKGVVFYLLGLLREIHYERLLRFSTSRRVYVLKMCVMRGCCVCVCVCDVRVMRERVCKECIYIM